jgi:voltage-gated potassium channel Kch
MEKHLQDLSEIRSLMERSSKFISLSGLSGISAGVIATLGGIFTYFNLMPLDKAGIIYYDNILVFRLMLIGGAVLVLALVSSIFFTVRKARLKGIKVWTSSSKRLLESMAIPLVSGGLFCLFLLQSAPHLLDAATLIFYGLALLNASKYTFDDIKIVAYIQISLGLLAGFATHWSISLLFWTLGFGVVHIVYGFIMYNKYDKV